jgi:hypothetical protein
MEKQYLPFIRMEEKHSKTKKKYFAKKRDELTS